MKQKLTSSIQLLAGRLRVPTDMYTLWEYLPRKTNSEVQIYFSKSNIITTMYLCLEFAPTAFK